MAIWDKLRTELDRAGRAAQEALDEGRIRLDAFRARQQADKAAQAIGYAVFRARRDGRDMDADSYAHLSGELAAHEAEAARLEARLGEIGARKKTKPADRAPESDAPATDAPSAATPNSPDRSASPAPDGGAGANI